MSNKYLNKINLFLLLAILVIGGAGAQNISAATRKVTKTADTNDNICNADCSLREAVAVAQNNDEIVFSPNLAGSTITLSAVIYIDKSITITGIGKLKISGGNQVNIFTVGNYVNVRMENLDIGNGYKNDQPQPWIGAGGAIAVYWGSLELDNCYIHNNKAFGPGGAIFAVESVINIKNSLLAANTSQSGGGIYAESSRVGISNTKFNLNTAAVSGGALFLNRGFLEMEDSNIYKSNSTIGGGGALYLIGSSNSQDGIFTIRNSAIFNNNAKTAGGIYNSGKLNLINSTLSGNKANAGDSGGLANTGTALLRNVTVTLNTATGAAGGLDSINGDINLGNTIVAGNSNGNNFSPNLRGSFTSAGYNLIGPSISAVLWGTQTGNQLNVADPMLNPLTYNGSATLNHLPKAGSPVLDAGSSVLAVDESGNPLLFDQRGHNRIFGASVDIGAVEINN